MLESFFNGTQIGVATGFTITLSGRRFLATNFHVVAQRDPATHKALRADAAVPDELRVHCHKNLNTGGRVIHSVHLYDAHRQGVWLEHPMQGVDVVLLDVSALQAQFFDVPLPPYQIELADGPSEAVSIVGFPFGKTVEQFPIWVNGTVASEPVLDFDGKPVWLVDARSREGQSGSPVHAYRPSGPFRDKAGTTIGITTPVQNLLGVYSGRISKESDLGMVWKPVVLTEIHASMRRTSVHI